MHARHVLIQTLCIVIIVFIIILCQFNLVRENNILNPNIITLGYDCTSIKKCTVCSAHLNSEQEGSYYKTRRLTNSGKVLYSYTFKNSLSL